MRVYLSSTWEDLEPHRAKMREALEKLRLSAFEDLNWYGMEAFAANSVRNSLDVSLETLRKCDMYIGVLGRRYGSIPPDSDVSYVESEYNMAVIEGKPRLLFLMEEGCVEWEQLGEDPEEEKRARLAELRASFRDDRLLDHFESPADLAMKVVVACLPDLVGERFRGSIDYMRVSGSLPVGETTATLTLETSRHAILEDGVDPATVVAHLKDSSGSPVPDGEPVRWLVLGGAIADPISSETHDGRASTEVRPLNESEPGHLIITCVAARSGVSASVPIEYFPAEQRARAESEADVGGLADYREADIHIEVHPRVAGEWALLDVTNVGTRKAAFRAQGRIVRGSAETEEAYSIQWRESEEPAIEIEAGGGCRILNVASASIPLPFPAGGTRYTTVDFHTARIPIRQGETTESFRRTQTSFGGIELELVITSDPPLPQPFERHYLLRPTEEPDWLPIGEALREGGDARASAKIEFKEIDPLDRLAKAVEDLAERVRRSDLIEDEQNRPSFAATQVSLTRLEQEFIPVFRLRQLSGLPTAGVQWRFRGPRFHMDWHQASGDALARTHLTGTFDLRQDPQPDDRVGTDEIGLELRLPWEGVWAHELHRWPLQRQELPSKVLWDIGDQLLPADTWTEPS